ncbi:MAG TPA: B12-binding domain-containing radical SAM protein [Anaerolineales bacterium]
MSGNDNIPLEDIPLETGAFKENLGSRRIPKIRMANFPNADEIVRQGLLSAPRSAEAVDIMLVNPPTPDGGYWIRTQHRVGRRTRENMVWPQVSLAQMAALLHPTYTVKVVDANAERMGWKEFNRLIDKYQPKYYLTQVTAPTLENDMYGCFIAHARGAKTIAFGTHVTPIPRESMRPYPMLDFVLVGEPDLTIRDLLDHLERKIDQRPPEILKLFEKSDPIYKPAYKEDGSIDLHGIKGLAWRNNDEIVVNFPRPFIADLNDLPIPMHELLPLQLYRMPLIKGPFTFIVTSRGCPAGCTYCIKHVSYQFSARVRSPELIMEEMWKLKKLGINNIHMYADLFTVSREQVVELCKRMIDEKIDIHWTSNSRVDYVDEELLLLMGKAGCRLISWGIESGNEQILKHAHKGAYPDKAERALVWAKKAGIMNWGYFIIGLPGETEATIRDTINFAKKLPLDIALFHVAAPYPGTPFFFEVVKEGWFRPGTRWEQVDMDKGTVLDYPNLPAERLLYWQKKAFREWAFRPGPMITYLKMLFFDWSTMKSALSVGLQHLSWATTDEGAPVSQQLATNLGVRAGGGD